MFVPEASYTAVVSCLTGYDLALSGGLLDGFQEFVELKAGTPSSLVWWSLALRLDDPDQPPPARSEQEKLTILLDLLDEFLAVDHSGVHNRRRLYHEWVVMAQQQHWYNPDLIRYGSSPPPETMSIDEAAEALGIERQEVVALIQSGRLSRVGRLGSQVRIPRSSVEKAQAPIDQQATPAPTASHDNTSSPETPHQIR
jgi:excisionase family DNA binding protein